MTAQIMEMLHGGKSAEQHMNPEQIRELDQTLQRWEIVLRQRAMERQNTANMLTQLAEKITRWFAKERSIAHQEQQLLERIAHMRDGLKHGSPEYIKTIHDVFNQLKENLSQEIQASQESSQLLPTENIKEEQFEITITGSAKKRTNSMSGPDTLGRFGQDVARADRTTGTIVIADGVSAGKDSFEVARVVSMAAERILNSIPENIINSSEAIQQWLGSHVNDIVHSVDSLGEKQGATTLLALRYVSQLDALVIIDIGDCQYTLVADNNAIPVQTREEHNNTPLMINHKSSGKGVIENQKNNAALSSMVKIINMKKIRETYPGATLSVVAASDGIANNTAKKSKKMIEDVAAELSHNPSHITSLNTDADDMSCIIMQLPALAETEELRKTAK